MEKMPVVFIDRDGTLNKEAGYINHLDNFKLYRFSYHAVRLLNLYQIKVIVITNQAGVGRGYFTEDFLKKIHKKMTKQLWENGACIDGLYYCPHHPSSKVREYAIDCNCRKPKTGLIENALKDTASKADMEKMYFIGDKFTDVKTGQNSGCKTAMVKTGYGKGELDSQNHQSPVPDKISDNLLTGVLWILSDLGLLPANPLI